MPRITCSAVWMTLSSPLARNIARMGDVPDRRARQGLGVLITIRVDAVAPPSGDLAVDEGDPQPFAGWLELLGILTRLLPSGQGLAGASQGLRGQRHPGGDTELGEDV